MVIFSNFQASKTYWAFETMVKVSKFQLELPNFQTSKARRKFETMVKVSWFQTSKLPKRVGNLKVSYGSFNNVIFETFKYVVIGLLIKAALGFKYDPHYVNVIIYYHGTVSH